MPWYQPEKALICQNRISLHHRIITSLQSNGRLTNVELADRVGLSCMAHGNAVA
jgi:hypothetical protein